MQLTRLAVVRPLTVLMGLLGLVIMGGVAYTFLKVDRLPPISIPFVSVNVTYTGATAQDIEQLVTDSHRKRRLGYVGVASDHLHVERRQLERQRPARRRHRRQHGRPRSRAARRGHPQPLADRRRRSARQQGRPERLPGHERGADRRLARLAVPGRQRPVRAPAAVGPGRRQRQHQRRSAARNPGARRLRQAGRLPADRRAAFDRPPERQRQRPGRLTPAGRADPERARTGRLQVRRRPGQPGRRPDDRRADPAARRGDGPAPTRRRPSCSG